MLDAYCAVDSVGNYDSCWAAAVKHTAPEALLQCVLTVGRCSNLLNVSSRASCASQKDSCGRHMGLMSFFRIPCLHFHSPRGGHHERGTVEAASSSFKACPRKTTVCCAHVRYSDIPGPFTGVYCRSLRLRCVLAKLNKINCGGSCLEAASARGASTGQRAKLFSVRRRWPSCIELGKSCIDSMVPLRHLAWICRVPVRSQMSWPGLKSSNQLADLALQVAE